MQPRDHLIHSTEKGGNEIQDESSVKRRPPFKSLCLIATCTTTMLVNIINNTSISISLPAIGKEFNIAETQLQWLVSAYALSSGCLLLIFGRLADLYGRKRVFIVGSAWLVTFSVACGFAPGSTSLLILRGLQGVGAAASIPASLGILAHSFPSGRLRSVAFATFAAGAPLGAVTGMAVGATLTQLSKLTWRSNFFMSACMTAQSLLAGLIVIDVDEFHDELDRRVDWIGSVLVTSGLVLVVFVLSDGEIAPQKWKNAYIVLCLLLGVTLLAMFLLWQRYLESIHQHLDAASSQSFVTPPPLMKLSLWTRGQGKFAAIMIVALFTWCAFIGWHYWAQLYYQNYLGYNPVSTMIRLLPMFVVGILCNICIAFIISRVPVIWILATGTSFTAFAGMFFALIDPDKSYWAYGFPGASCSVFGADFVFAAGTMFVAKIVEPHEQSLSGALFQTMTQLGTALGVTVTTIVFNQVHLKEASSIGIVNPEVPIHVPQRYGLGAYKAAQWTAFTFGIIATILVLICMRDVGIIADEKRTTVSYENEAEGHNNCEPAMLEDSPLSGAQHILDMANTI